jgi:peptidoglycan/xylan/chitin deacetylase (PgdA/CDA1 family)
MRSFGADIARAGLFIDFAMLKNLARKGLDIADSVCALVSPRSHAGSGSLITLLFHSLYRNRDETANQNITTDDFRRFIGHVLDSGFTPVSPAQVDAGLGAGGKYVMITFDDGYFNNTLALDVLERFHAPATFFISSDHVQRNKGFWWDAMNRELENAGMGERARRAEIDRVKAWSGSRIEEHLLDSFGPGTLDPRSDLDRPFTPAELRDFARSKWVHLGNHTCDHAILTNCSVDEIARQIQGCQEALADMVGYAPLAIAYPNGDYSEQAVAAARRSGLRIGVTVRPFSNRLPLDDDKSRMTLGRFMPEGARDMAFQWRKFSSEFVPSHMLKTLMMSAY